MRAARSALTEVKVFIKKLRKGKRERDRDGEADGRKEGRDLVSSIKGRTFINNI